MSVFFLFFFAFVIVGARAVQLHLGDNQRLQTLSERQYKRRIVVSPKRGSLLDRHGETLAMDLKVDSLYAAPHRIEDPQTLAKKLKNILNISEKTLFNKLNQSDKKFVWIKRRLSQEESVAIQKLEEPGLGFLPEHKRFYPNSSLASNLLGAVGYDAQALAGLELSLDNYLKSTTPPLLVEKDARGRTYGAYALIGQENPQQVVLTLDKHLQYLAERELKKGVEKAKAKRGMALVVEVASGDILAMASYPSFDPNHYSKYPIETWQNLNISYSFEPGSTFKAITASAALESGVIKEGEKINCENGKLKIGKDTINDHHGYALLNLQEIIKHSSNIGSFKLAQRLGKARFLSFIQAFGFGHKSGLEIPGENPGLVASTKTMGDLQLGTIGFGQGISTTPLQIAMAYSALANGGKLMKPRLIKEIQDSEGKTIKKIPPEVRRQVVQAKVAKTVIEALSQVVQEGGTGTQAALEAYQVTGKTGTAQKVLEGQRGYAKDKYIASFVGLAPAEDPKLVVLVSIDEPKGAYYGGLVSAPVFKEIMGQALAYLQVPTSLGQEAFQVVSLDLKEKQKIEDKKQKTKNINNKISPMKETSP
ncbi:MAG: penicillin-binding protein 2, partial [Deltaproteobacteria bacterium]|nr:penicillin-binding protein 2 [Deltaproteobacteria bacterium]